MITREGLWRRVAGAPAWPLAWALALASALPWLVPEAWDGGLSGRWIALGWAAVLGSALLLRWRRWAWIPLMLVLPWGALGGLRQRARWERQLPSGFQSLEGTLDAPWTLREDRWLGRLAVQRPANLKGLALPLSLPAVSDSPLPAAGTPVRVRAELRPVVPAPTFLGERPLWRARSDEAPRRAHIPSAQLFEVLGPPRPSPILRLQLWARSRFEALPLEGAARDLWGALALGIPPASEERASVFAESGTLHILVVSGLQLTLIIACVEFLLRHLLRRGASAGAVLAGVAYACIVGFSAPVWRGLLMGSAWALGRASGWRLPPALGLHLALLVWLMTHPAAGCEPGFLLAWGALLGLMWGAEPLAALVSPLLGPFAPSLARLTAPWLATLPLLALLHGGAPTWGLISNLLVLPAITVLTPVCLGLTLLPLPGAAAWVGHALDLLGTRLVPTLAHITPLAAGRLWPWIALALGWLLLAQLHAGLGRTRALAAIMVVASFALLGHHGIGLAPKSLSLESVDIGQGDALVLRQPGGDATVIDTGPSPWAARRLVRALSRRGVTEPVHLVLTHPHGDHAGGWATLSRLWPMADAIGPALSDPEDPWAPYRPAVPARLDTALRGDRWQRGDLELSVRWPPKPFTLPDANMVSLVLRARWRDRELWLMGDALQLQERDLMDLGEPGHGPPHRALKVGHHGSRSSSDPAWIKALAPDAALITAGRANRFEHPHPETRGTLSAAGVPFEVAGERRGLRLEAVEGGWRLEGGDGASAFIPFRSPGSPSAPR
ncbi:MAG TPA: ComEC/Rec2 family competence protein [Holophagaceae bacterium]|nr:ComEC/Rec2 family competence protein [Holophagaceae bacterium]